MKFVNWYKNFFGSKSLLVPLFLLYFTGIFLISCNRTDSGREQPFLAKVGDSYLFPSDVRQILPANLSSQDSVEIVDRFLNTWIRKQVFLQEARKNLTADQLNFEKQIEEYRNSLIIFSYENELIRQQLDTTVTDNQLAEFYEKNKADFRLRDDIVKADFVKLPMDSPDLSRFRRLFRSSDPDEAGLLEEYCIQNAASYFIDQDSWLIFRDLLREVPLQVSNAGSYLRSNQFIEVNDNNFRYFVKILDYQLQGSDSPLAFERENIRSIIINQRKHELINQVRNQIYQDAVDRGQVEVRK